MASTGRSVSHVLSKEQALSYLNNKLQITDFDKDFRNDKRSTLNNIMSQYLGVVPFQGVSQLSIDPDKRVAPTLEENIQFGLTCEGGRCWTMNSFMCVLLDVLGYNVYPGLSSIAVNIKGGHDHAIIIVKDLVKEGDTYLVDVGFGYPIKTAVCLDFEDESETFHYSHSTYKYVKRGDTFIRFQNISKTDAEAFPTIEGNFCHAYYFTLEPVTFEKMREKVNENVYISKNADHLFHRCLYIRRYPNEGAVLMKDNILLKEQADGKIKAEHISYDKMEETILTNYSYIPKDKVQKGVKNWLRDIFPKINQTGNKK